MTQSFLITKDDIGRVAYSSMINIPMTGGNWSFDRLAWMIVKEENGQFHALAGDWPGGPASALVEPTGEVIATSIRQVFKLELWKVNEVPPIEGPDDKTTAKLIGEHHHKKTFNRDVT